MPLELAPALRGATVFVLDDDAGARAHLLRLLQRSGIAARAHSTAEEFFASFDPGTPACVLLDLALPGMGGSACLERLAQCDPPPPVVAVSGTTAVADAVRALRLGALHLVQKPLAEDEVLDAVRAALVEAGVRHERRGRRLELTARLARMTRRERDVYELVVRGATNKDVGAVLGIAPKTVEVHRASVMRKLGVESLASLVRLSVDATASGADAPRRERQSNDAPFER